MKYERIPRSDGEAWTSLRIRLTQTRNDIDEEIGIVLPLFPSVSIVNGRESETERCEEQKESVDHVDNHRERKRRFLIGILRQDEHLAIEIESVGSRGKKETEKRELFDRSSSTGAFLDQHVRRCEETVLVVIFE